MEQILHKTKKIDDLRFATSDDINMLAEDINMLIHKVNELNKELQETKEELEKVRRLAWI